MSEPNLAARIQKASTFEELDVLARNLPENDEVLRMFVQARREILEKDAAILEKDAVILEKDAVIDKRTLFSALTYGEDLKKLAYDGKPSSSDHLSAESEKSFFDCTTVCGSQEIIGEDGTFREKLREAPVRGSFENKASRSVFNEADLQGIVHTVLQDAVSICNIMLDLDDQHCLLVRREANLLTNRPDHAAVYFVNCDIPVLSVEDKLGEDSVDDNRVHGQKFDQMLDTVLLTLRDCAIGVVTSVVKTRIAWIGGDADEIVKEADFLAIDKLQACKDRLGNLSPRQHTPSPRKQDAYPTRRDKDIEIAEQRTLPRTKKRKIELPKRKLVLSQPFKAEDLIHVFCNAIIAGILLHIPDKQVVTLPMSEEEQTFSACVLLQTQEKPPMISSLTTRIQGRATKPRDVRLPGLLRRAVNVISSKKYYLVGLLNSGPTYTVLRAVTQEGYECVVKMYIREYDEDWRKIPNFDSNGRDAVSGEAQMYHNLYPEISEYVWTEKLCGRHCLILPFFEEVPKEDRMSVAESVSSLYKERFVSSGYRVTVDNVLWRHVGLFNEKSYLYSLGHLKTGNGGVEAEILKEILTERAAARTVQGVTDTP